MILLPLHCGHVPCFPPLELPVTHVAVIGAGFSGLAAALRLAQAGAQVTVLDALDRPGGKAALGYDDFSSGPTVVTMPQIFAALHARLGWDAPALTPAHPTTTYHALSGRTFAPEALNVVGSLDPTMTQLSRAEGRRYRQLLFAARQMYSGAADTFLFAPPPTRTQLAQYALRAGRQAAPLTPLARYVRSGPFLTPFWLRFATYLGADPYRAPAVLHNIAWVELGDGIWHLPGGLLALAERLYAEALDRGVRFEFGIQVQHLSTHGGRVLGAHTSRGAFAADRWVSAADRALTLGWLGQDTPTTPRGVSGFALQLRLGEDLGQGHHIFWPADYAREWQDIRAGRLPSEPTLYLHLDGPRAFLLVNAPPDPRLGLSPERKADYARHLLQRLQSRFPLPVVEWQALAPADYARTGLGGALYGRAPHGLLGSLRPGWRLPQARNLVQVGGTVHPGGGVPLSLLSGWNGAGSLLGLDYDSLDGEKAFGKPAPAIK
ncbi:methoxyneurosporene dehydrogenase [Deinococcus radiodurans R1 = ATCC 13939 = DSM 20539]|uniref:Methoxyneurosporene dehydrogenase n=1 Tax=Deinococcus radiodurans (strain ATCC 13939 / DSM 20539 / JCM 16871 / CCUG 27074 / LMG 4051 / NBRC 15346 / NCIMB 9279 / VKM B-1422 / R1) TaxID=243230 RepID=Q9RS77_DEIRA|nr:methoxyneurosporene dehydrogenase [Deinococcus radiodurans R1 = ATCC 13939 = DSM 20539]